MRATGRGLDVGGEAGEEYGEGWMNASASCESYGVKLAQEWLGHSAPATTLRHYVRLTTAARAKAVAGLDEVTRVALETAQAQRAQEDAPVPSNVVELASRRVWPPWASSRGFGR
jgi:hypothetical protein